MTLVNEISGYRRVPPESVIKNFNIFDRQYPRNSDLFYKLFKGELLFMFWLTLLLQIFYEIDFCQEVIIKIIWLLLVATSNNGLIWQYVVPLYQCMFENIPSGNNDNENKTENNENNNNNENN